jgi:hypothetical protein
MRIKGETRWLNSLSVFRNWYEVLLLVATSITMRTYATSNATNRATAMVELINVRAIDAPLGTERSTDCRLSRKMDE